MFGIVPEIRFRPRFARLRGLVTNFKSDKRGNVAVIAAIAALPLMSAVGCAIDYSNASMIKTKLQAAADAATFATVSNNSPAFHRQNDDGQRSHLRRLDLRHQFFQCKFEHGAGGRGYTGRDAIGTVTKTGTTITATVTFSAKVPTYFMGIVGYQQTSRSRVHRRRATHFRLTSISI